MIGTLEDFRAYATERGNSAPSAADDADATAALLRASDHMMFYYVPEFTTGYDETSTNVEPATYELAILELATPGLFNKTYTPGERKVLTEAEGFKWTVLDGDTKGGVAMAESTKVQAMLKPYLRTRDVPFAAIGS